MPRLYNVQSVENADLVSGVNGVDLNVFKEVLGEDEVFDGACIDTEQFSVGEAGLVSQVMRFTLNDARSSRMLFQPWVTGCSFSVESGVMEHPRAIIVKTKGRIRQANVRVVEL